MTIQVTLVDFKWSVGRHLVIGQDCRVHELHERRIADPRILDRLAKTQNIWVKMRLVHSGNAILLPRVGNARLIPPFPVWSKNSDAPFSQSLRANYRPLLGLQSSVL
jgi:hypothetical protein